MTDNFTKFLVISYRKDIELPSSSPTVNCQKALIRVVQPPEARLYTVFSFLGDYIATVDRRPALSSQPFSNAYIIELFHDCTVTRDGESRTEWTVSKANGISKAKHRTWEDELFEIARRMCDNGWETSLLGIW